MSEYADGFDDGKGEKFDELMVEIVSLRLDFQNCEAKRVGAINSLREHINICNGLKIENAALREQLAKAQSEYICTCGIRVTPHRCPTDNGF